MTIRDLFHSGVRALCKSPVLLSSSSLPAPHYELVFMPIQPDFVAISDRICDRVVQKSNR